MKKLVMFVLGMLLLITSVNAQVSSDGITATTFKETIQIIDGDEIPYKGFVGVKEAIRRNFAIISTKDVLAAKGGLLITRPTAILMTFTEARLDVLIGSVTRAMKEATTSRGRKRIEIYEQSGFLFARQFVFGR